MRVAIIAAAALLAACATSPEQASQAAAAFSRNAAAGLQQAGRITQGQSFVPMQYPPQGNSLINCQTRFDSFGNQLTQCW